MEPSPVYWMMSFSKGNIAYLYQFLPIDILDNLKYTGVFWGVYDSKSKNNPTDGLRNHPENRSNHL